MINIRHVLEKAVQANPDKTYLFFKDEEISYSRFNDTVNKVGNGLLNLGVQKGAKVCLMLPNMPEFLYLWLALNKIGAVMVPINTAFKEIEIEYIVKHSEAELCVATEDFIQMISNIRDRCPLVKNLICVGNYDGQEVISFDEMVEDQKTTLRNVPIEPGDVAGYIYTSGTTGQPKAVMLPHSVYVRSGEAYNHWCALRPEDRLMTCLPLFHANAQVYSVMGSLIRGASLILLERFSASRFWEQSRFYNATVTNFAGSITSILWGRLENRTDADNPIRVAFGGATPLKGKQREFEWRFGLTLLGGYSLSECPIGCVQPIDGRRKDGSMGKQAAHPDPNLVTEVRIVGEDFKESPAGDVGEVVVRGPALMLGYFGDPDKTAEAFRDGWLLTGDLGYEDEDGYFWFVDRKKDIIRRRGENISSAEVEGVIASCPGVSECAVIPVPSEVGEDDVKACIVLSPGAEVSASEIFSWCEERLAYFKLPRYIEFYRELPKTSTAKIEKHKLRSEHDPAKDCADMGAFIKRK